jgi:hypothetical protein
MNDLIFPVLGSTNHMSLSEVLDLFKTQFFAIVRQHLGVVQKCWITGVLPVSLNSISPLLFTTDISASHMYHGVCGFAAAEVEAIAQNYLSPETTPDDITQLLHHTKQSYGGYMFSTHSDVPSLYHPQLFFSHLHAAAGKMTALQPNEEATAIHSTKVLNAMPVNGCFSVNDLFPLLCNLLHSTITHPLGPTGVVNIGTDPDVTWSLLYYFGVITRGRIDQTLVIPNTTMRHLVSPEFHYHGNRC